MWSIQKFYKVSKVHLLRAKVFFFFGYYFFTDDNFFTHILFQAFHSAVKKFEENETTGVKGAAKVPLQGRGTASPWGLEGDAP